MGVGPLIDKLEKEKLKDPGGEPNRYEEPTDSDSDDDDERFTSEAVEKRTADFEKKYKRFEDLIKNFTDAGNPNIVPMLNTQCPTLNVKSNHLWFYLASIANE